MARRPIVLNSHAFSARFQHRFPSVLSFLVLLLIARITVLAKGHVDTDYGYIDAFALASIGVCVLTLIPILLHPHLVRQVRRFARGALAFLLAFYLTAAFSALWSTMPLYSLYRACEVLIEAVAICLIFVSLPTRGYAEIFLLRGAFITAVLTLLGNLKVNGFALSLSALHTNSYSNIGAMTFVYSSLELLAMRKPPRHRYQSHTRSTPPSITPSVPPASPRRTHELLPTDLHRKRSLWLALISGATFLVLGTSAGSNIAALVALLLGLLTIPHAPLLKISVSMLLLVSMAAPSLYEGLLPVLAPGKTMEGVTSLTGRTGLWETLWPLALQSPLVGHGFLATTRSVEMKTHSAHNCLLQAQLDTGLLGTTLLLICFTLSLTSAYSAISRHIPGAVGSFGAIASAIVVNMSSPFLAVTWVASTAVFVGFLAYTRLWILDSVFHATTSPPARRRLADTKASSPTLPAVRH